MPKLLVVSTLDMTEQQLQDYAESVQHRTKELTAQKFLQTLKGSGQVNVKYPDGTFTTYQIIKELQ